MASKTRPLYYDDPTKIDFDTNAADKFKVVLPLTPSLYEIYKSKNKEQSDIDKMLFKPVKAGDTSVLERTMRLWCFKMLKKLGYGVLQNTYLTEKTHFAVVRAV